MFGFFYMNNSSIRIITLLGILLISLAALWYTKNMTALREKIESQTLIIAHRGSSSTAPENTVSSVEQAILSDADLIELDFFINQTGNLLVIHDDLIEEQFVPNMSTKEFDQLNVSQHEKFEDSYIDVQPPYLEEMLALILTKSTPLIEYKRNHEHPKESAERAARELINLLNRRNWKQKVVVQSFDIHFLAFCREMEPELILGWLIMDELVVHLETVEQELNPEIIAWKRTQLTAENIQWLQERSDARIWSWYSGEDKVNDPARTQNMLNMGNQGHNTDYPAQPTVV